jgi:hypothetical protein
MTQNTLSLMTPVVQCLKWKIPAYKTSNLNDLGSSSRVCRLLREELGDHSGFACMFRYMHFSCLSC